AKGRSEAVESFDWVENPRGRRGALRLIHAAVCRGWLEGPGDELMERRLVTALGDLLDDPHLTPREVIRIGRIFAAACPTRAPGSHAHIRTFSGSREAGSIDCDVRTPGDATETLPGRLETDWE